MPLLTPLEARVVDTITRWRDFSEATALKEIAGDAGLSEAMVVNVAKKLGFNGFRDFRSALDHYNPGHRQPAPGDLA